jgi:hypothetical protein
MYVLYYYYYYRGVFTPCKNSNIETRSHDYATVDKAVFSPCCAEPSRASPRLLPGNSHKHLDDARAGKDHVTASPVTSRVRRNATIEAFSRMSDQGFIGETEDSSGVVVGEF